MDAGVRSEYLESVFPAESFPAWQTIQTGVSFGMKKNFGEKICSLCIYVECAGLYPESHGIVGNQFYDREVSFSSNFLQNNLNVSLSAPASYPYYHYPHLHPHYLDLQISSSSLSAPASYPCYLYLDLQSILIVSANNLILP